MAVLAIAGAAQAATEQEKQAAIDAGLAWLDGSFVDHGDGVNGHWDYQNNDGDLAATASAALAFIEEGILPNATGTAYEQKVDKALNYIFARADIVNISAQPAGHPENYDNSLDNSGDGNGQGIYFDPANNKRDVYTTGLVAPVVYALGEALGPDTDVGKGTVADMSYREVMRDVIDWYSYGQNDPATGVHRGGWRYTDNYGSSDNSTAQWGALPILYGDDWGLDTPQFVKDELELYVDYIQNPNGGSGYDHPNTYVNEAKTGGLLLELAVIDPALGIDDPRIQAALGYLNANWNDGASYSSSTWYGGNLGNPYAMWAIYKGLEVWSVDTIPNAPDAGSFQVGQDWEDPIVMNADDDWFAHYCEWLVNDQNSNGSWNGYSYWNGALSAGWYINILNAAGVPEPVDPVPVPGAFLLGSLGLAFSGWKIRRRKEA